MTDRYKQRDKRNRVDDLSIAAADPHVVGRQVVDDYLFGPVVRRCPYLC